MSVSIMAPSPGASDDLEATLRRLRIPITYLKTYPFPAFVVRVTAAPPAPQRPPLRSHGTDITVRDSRDSGEGLAGEDDQHDDVTDLEAEDEVSPLSSERATSYYSSSRTSSFSILSTPSQLSPYSPSSSRSSQFTSPNLPGSLLGTPDSDEPTIVWGNEHFMRLTEGRALSQSVDVMTLQLFNKWLETAFPVHGASPFALNIGRPPLQLQLVQTRIQPGGGPITWVVVTGLHLAVTPSRQSKEVRQSSVHSSISDQIGMPGHTSHRRRMSNDSSGRASTASQPPPLHRFGTPPPISHLRSWRRRLNEYRLGTSIVSPGGPHLPKIPQHDTNTPIPIDCRTLLDQKDWSTTSMGPREQWPATLNTIIEIVMNNSSQDALWMNNEEITLLYNQKYTDLIDHPKSFGGSAREIWAPVWEDYGGSALKALAGDPQHGKDSLAKFKMTPRGHFIESYHDWSMLPVYDHDGRVLAIYVPSTDVTSKVITSRRHETSRELFEQLMFCRTTQDLYATLADVLERNPSDAPFMMCYSVQERHSTATGSATDSSTQLELTLESTAGVPPNHPSAPAHLSISLPGARSSISSTFSGRSRHSQLERPGQASVGSIAGGKPVEEQPAWPFARAISTRQCIFVDNCSEIIEGYPLRQWEALPDTALVVPLIGEGSTEIPGAVFVIGLSVAKPLDDEYESWIQTIRSHTVSAISSVTAFEHEVKRRLEYERMERAKTAWFQGAAHEFRSPLTLIAGPLEDVLQTDLTPQQRKSIRMASRNVQRLLQLVSTLLDFSRIEAGHITPRLSLTDLGEFVSDLADLFAPVIAKHKLKFELEIEPRSQRVGLDPLLMEMALSNLISNALKYTQEGNIAIKVWYDDDQAYVSIKDSGVGIPESELSQVTDWYHRSRSARESGKEGSGIGLALCNEILRLHNGELLRVSHTAEEAGEGVEVGSTFTACIPHNSTAEEILVPAQFGKYGRQAVQEALTWVRPDDETPFSENSPRSNRDPSSPFADGFMFESSDTILVVDDDHDIRSYLKSVFRPFCVVLEASSAEEALKVVRRSPPSLILTDNMMPGMSGHELLIEIRGDPSTRFIPVVLLSASNDDDERISAILDGAEDYLTKPFKPRELVARVHLQMQMGKKRATLEKLFKMREEEIAVLSDYCPSGILRADQSGRVTYGNDAFRQPAGIATDDDLDTWQERICDETWPEFQRLWEDMVYGEQTTTTITWKWETGKSMSGQFIRLDRVTPALSGILGCVTDISYQEERLHEAERRRHEAEESKHQQELLVDLTSHEIRTPVSAILQCSSLVKENLVALLQQYRFAPATGYVPTKEMLNDLSEDIEALESIYQCGLVQERIADDVLSLARIQLDMLSMHDIEMDLVKEANKVFSVFNSEARMKKIDLTLTFGESLAEMGITRIMTDPVRVGQVVTNLISNAIRFTAGSDVRRISVHYEAAWEPPEEGSCVRPIPQQGRRHSEGGLSVQKPLSKKSSSGSLGLSGVPLWLYVSVKDTGPGMSVDEKNMLFKRFHQGNKMIHTRYGGSGLGLFICKKITELLDGGVEVESELGKGSEFRFYIKAQSVGSPLPPLPSPAPRDTPLLENPSLIPGSGVGSRSMTPRMGQGQSHETTDTGSGLNAPNGALHLLVVEDNVINQTVLRRQLTKAGLTCECANNGQEALALLHEVNRTQNRHGPEARKPFDLVIMDLEMPVMDGLTAVKHIRADEASGLLQPQIVIALTGNARQGQIDQALGAGMDDVVIKPYRLSDLIAKINLAVATKKSLATV